MYRSHFIKVIFFSKADNSPVFSIFYTKTIAFLSFYWLLRKKINIKNQIFKMFVEKNEDEIEILFEFMLTDVFHSYCSAIINHRIAYEFFPIS